MSKELPYFRFTAFEWLNDDISLEDYSVKGLFIDICAYYWFKDCSLTQAKLKQRFSNALPLIEALLKSEIIKCKNGNDFIEISFLNKQFDELSELRKRRQNAGSKGGKQSSSKAQAKLKQSSSYKDKDKDKDKDNNIHTDFDAFWDQYHIITGLNKSDKEAAFKYWKKLNQPEKEKALQNIQSYFNSLSDKKYCKKARTYLSDKNFNDEFVKPFIPSYGTPGFKLENVR